MVTRYNEEAPDRTGIWLLVALSGDRVWRIAFSTADAHPPRYRGQRWTVRTERGHLYHIAFYGGREQTTPRQRVLAWRSAEMFDEAVYGDGSRAAS